MDSIDDAMKAVYESQQYQDLKASVEAAIDQQMPGMADDAKAWVQEGDVIMQEIEFLDERDNTPERRAQQTKDVLVDVKFHFEHPDVDWWEHD